MRTQGHINCDRAIINRLEVSEVINTTGVVNTVVGDGITAEATTLTAQQSGTTVFLVDPLTLDHVITLPTSTAVHAGWKATFVVTNAVGTSAGDIVITTASPAFINGSIWVDLIGAVATIAKPAVNEVTFTIGAGAAVAAAGDRFEVVYDGTSYQITGYGGGLTAAYVFA